MYNPDVDVQRAPEPNDVPFPSAPPVPDWFTTNAPATPPPPAPTPPGPSAAGYDLKKLRDALAAHPERATPENLKAFIAAHPEFATGVTIGGSKGNKLYAPGGAYLADVIRGTSGPNPSWDWDESTGGSASTGSLGLGDFGSLAKRWDKTFVAPSADEVRNSPGYQFARDEGIHGIEASRAQQGTLLAGGTSKDIGTFATNLADTMYQTKYQNALSEYAQAYNIFRNDNNDIFNRFDTLSARGTSAALGATS